MPRTPDEIKKGLECCIAATCPTENGCPYRLSRHCGTGLKADALALIQQLQAENAEKDGRIKQLEEQFVDANKMLKQLEAERDAAVGELKRIGDCRTCKYDDICTFRFPNCVECEKPDCPCHTCEYRGNWQWRGVQKEDNHA